MRWRIPILLTLVSVGFLSCDGAPTAPRNTSAPEASPRLSVHGRGGAVRWMPDPNCAVLDGDGNFYLVDCTNQIATWSMNGNAVAVTRATGVPNASGRHLSWDAWHPPAVLLGLWGLNEPPAPCWVIGPEGEALFTVNWKASITPSGSAQMTCHYAKRWEWVPPPDWPPE